MKKTLIKNEVLAILVAFTAIFIPSALFGKWIEGVFFFICHWLVREQFKYQYHSIMPAMCRLITAVVFFFGTTFVLPLSASLFSAIFINYFIGWIGNVKKQSDIYQVKYNELLEEINTPKPFNTDTCSKEELVERCRNLGYGTENILLAIDFFIDKTKQSIIADRLSIDEKSVQQRKQRMKKQLNR